jgi:predicted Ser/Thr protein kinase
VNTDARSAPVDDVVAELCTRIHDRDQQSPLDFSGLLRLAAEEPSRVFRNVFQRLYDMIRSYVGAGVNEYPDDPESINFVHYDCERLFIEGADTPFFADRLFANRFINHIAAARQGTQQNRIYVFEGPHGSGKSTFLNNLLLKFELYTRSVEGTCYETLWRLDKKALRADGETGAHALLSQLRSLSEGAASPLRRAQAVGMLASPADDCLEVPCPSHDNPILLIPKAYRREVWDRLLANSEFTHRLVSEKQYEWVFQQAPCTICTSIYDTLLQRLDSPLAVFGMVFARPYVFNRRLGQGISVFNPGDPVSKPSVLTNPLLRDQLSVLLRDSQRVRYLFSRYASTNDGVYALMDVKGNNRKRFANLHGIISEGLHKIDDIEENVNSLFLALLNPEDRTNIGGMLSFADRVSVIKIPYVLDYNTEVKIYRNVFGTQVERSFLPRVLQNFAKVIIASRLKEKSEALRDWIPDATKYRLFCDPDLQLLKMDVYAGVIPSWLSEEDRRSFSAKRRMALIGESEAEGDKGLSGRDSIKTFGAFVSTFAKDGNLVNMGMLCHYFRELRKDLGAMIPAGFLDALVSSYNYAVLQEVKESLYSYNEERIARDIQNYIFATNFEPPRVERCVYTGETIEITDDYFDGVERRLLGSAADSRRRQAFRAETQTQFTTKVLTQEMMLEGRSLAQTSLYGALHERYVHNLKEKVLEPFRKNDTFRNAVKEYGTDAFNAVDARIQDEVVSLMRNLEQKFGYSDRGAKQVCIYVIDQDLTQMYSNV